MALENLFPRVAIGRGLVRGVAAAASEGSKLDPPLEEHTYPIMQR